MCCGAVRIQILMVIVSVSMRERERDRHRDVYAACDLCSLACLALCKTKQLRHLLTSLLLSLRSRRVRADAVAACQSDACIGSSYNTC